jgi:cation diffusion facilitator CzcD-associated flavoprotein CzcO
VRTTDATDAEHLDVVIVGAGLSGIGAACHLERRCPDRSYVLLEGREAIGGTWDLFRYPGIRSDSDMHTLGYSFRPWEDAKTIADGPSILSYIHQTAEEYGVKDKIRLGHKVIRAEWRTEESRWRVTAKRADTGEEVELTASFLLMCSGYYDYDQGYTPTFEGQDDFQGEVVHPQHWPEDLDYAGKRVVVIGSGATAITLVPAMAKHAAHVTMLQRSPSYVVTLPAIDPLAKVLRRVLPPKAAYAAVRAKNVAVMTLSYQLMRRYPKAATAVIRKALSSQLPDDYDIDTHFKPHYNPWDQRLCVCPDGDLFRTLRGGNADVVTDHIETFTPRGIRLRSGRELEADVVVSATGLNLLALGGIEIDMDGRTLELPEHVAYKGMMLDGVPNAALAIGYTNASWTLKADLTCEYVCRLLNHMSEHGYDRVTPEVGNEHIERRPLIDLDSGYVRRSVAKFPHQGSKLPWRLYQNYPLDIATLRLGKLEDGVLQFRRGDSGVSVNGRDAAGSAAVGAAA